MKKSKIAAYIQNLVSKNIIVKVDHTNENLSFEVEDDNKEHYVFNGYLGENHYGLFDSKMIEEIVVCKKGIQLNNHYLETYDFVDDDDDLEYIFITLKIEV